MVKAFLAFVFLFGSMALADVKIDPCVWRSSTTSTSDSGKVLISSATRFHGVIVSSATTAGSVKIYNSSWTTSGLVADIDASAKGSYFYDTKLNSGLVYTTAGEPTVTILYLAQ